jgi:hypothetical protein
MAAEIGGRKGLPTRSQSPHEGSGFRLDAKVRFRPIADVQGGTTVDEQLPKAISCWCILSFNHWSHATRIAFEGGIDLRWNGGPHISQSVRSLWGRCAGALDQAGRLRRYR